LYQNVVGGLIATAVALCLVAADGDVRPELVVAGGIVLLLPSVTLIGAVQDAITGQYVTTAARAFETSLLTEGIISDVAIALSVGVRLGLPVRIDDHASTALLNLQAQLLAAGDIAASLAVANYAPRRTVPAAAAGIVGWATFVLVDQLQLPPTLASAVAAVMIGLGSRTCARRRRSSTWWPVSCRCCPDC